jgi:coenzyme F420-reducing hydrogenase gamma subunit
VIKEVYKDANVKDNEFFNMSTAKAINEVVPVDYYVHGCPINRDEFKKVLTAVVMGKKPDIPEYPVCVECKKNENICLFELGKFCLGPITRAGCNSICPNHGSACDGCRGMLRKPDVECVIDVLERYDLTYEEMKNRCTIYNTRMFNPQDGMTCMRRNKNEK